MEPSRSGRNRRKFLAGAASFIAAGLLPKRVLALAGPYAFTQGTFDITVVSDGLASVTNTFTVFVPGLPPPVVQIGGVAWLPGIGFRFSFDVPEGMAYSIEATEHLESPGSWIPVFSGVGQSGMESHTNTVSAGMDLRCYRIRM